MLTLSGAGSSLAEASRETSTSRATRLRRSRGACPYNWSALSGEVPLAAETTLETPARRELYIDRRVCTITPDRIDVKPARSIIVLPIFTLGLGIACFLAVALSSGAFPFWLQIFLTLAAVVLVPVSGMGIVYAFAGAHLVVERKKESAVLQQGYLGMGVGTQELVPFWKIDRIRIQEVSPRDGRSNLEDFAQFEVALIKVSGKAIEVGTVTVLRSHAADGLARARELAEAIAEMAGSRVSVSRRRKQPAS